MGIEREYCHINSRYYYVIFCSVKVRLCPYWLKSRAFRQSNGLWSKPGWPTILIAQDCPSFITQSPISVEPPPQSWADQDNWSPYPLVPPLHSNLSPCKLFTASLNFSGCQRKIIITISPHCAVVTMKAGSCLELTWNPAWVNRVGRVAAFPSVPRSKEIPSRLLPGDRPPKAQGKRGRLMGRERISPDTEIPSMVISVDGKRK